MALRKPLVQVAGKLQQLQAGDTLDATVTGGEQVQLTNDEAGAIVIGTPVYSDANDGVKKAQANAATTAEVIGLVGQTSIANGVAGAVQLAGPLTATTAQWDAVTGGSGGLVFRTRYYVDPTTAGKLTSTAPSTPGQVVAEVGIAFSATEMQISLKAPILL